MISSKHQNRETDMTKNQPITYTFTKGLFTISVHAQKGLIRESIRNSDGRELSYQSFRSSCASNRDLVASYAECRLAHFSRSAHA